MTLRLLITRHGETEFNVQNRIQGSIDSELTPTGIEQAQMLAEHLRDTHIDYVITSDLVRQLATAETIAVPRGITIVHDQRLNERNWGRFNGCYERDIDTGGIPLTRYLFYLKDPNGEHNPAIERDPKNQGETIERVMQRVGSFYDELFAKYSEGTFLIVGSQYSNAYGLNHIFGVPLKRTGSTGLIFVVQENMCINEIRLHPEREGGAGKEIELIHTNFMEHVHSTNPS